MITHNSHGEYFKVQDSLGPKPLIGLQKDTNKNSVEEKKIAMSLPAFLFPYPSLFVGAASAVSLLSMGNAGLSEFRGKHLQYSKFSKVGVEKKEVPSRIGMVVTYTPAFLAGAASFALFPGGSLRFFILQSAVTLHFLKRVVEVIFIHKYSGGMPLDSTILISINYTFMAITMIYSQYLTQGFPEPPWNLQNPGTILFLIGIIGNFYHHFLLSKLRGKNGEKEYKIPRGGLFELVICPHYLFEILEFWGFAMISQTLYSFCYTIGTTMYLVGRSYGTRKWYLSKFDDFPNHIKAIVPFIF